MVGTKYVDIIDENRLEKLGKKEGNRRISIRFYFPISEAKGGKNNLLT